MLLCILHMLMYLMRLIRFPSDYFSLFAHYCCAVKQCNHSKVLLSCFAVLSHLVLTSAAPLNYHFILTWHNSEFEVSFYSLPMQCWLCRHQIPLRYSYFVFQLWHTAIEVHGNSKQRLWFHGVRHRLSEGSQKQLLCAMTKPMYPIYFWAE